MTSSITADWIVLAAIVDEYMAAIRQLSPPSSELRDWTMPATLGRIGDAAVVCVFSGKGSASTAAALQYATARCSASSVALLGIAGGFPLHRVFRGDVVIAQTVLGYDFGKLVNGAYL